MENECSLPFSQDLVTGPKPYVTSRYMLISYEEEL
jgi:hypothetical protein